MTELYLHRNEISDISAVANLTNLTTLKLKGNPLTAGALPIIQGLQAGGTNVEYDLIVAVTNIWSSQIIVSSSNQQINPSSIQFGMAEGATDNYDVGLDVVAPGWNMISIPGVPQEMDPAKLQTVDNSLILPLYRWNPTVFSYEPVTELKFGEGYWALTIKPEGITLQIAINNSANSYKLQSILTTGP